MNVLTIATILLFVLINLVLLFSKKTKLKTVGVFLLAILIIEVAFVGFRNNNSFYKTPEEAFHAVYFGNYEVKTVLVGNETSFVAGSNARETVYVLLDKADNGWRIGNTIDDETQTILFRDTFSAVVFHRKNTRDYYVEVLFPLSGEHSVSDNRQSTFQKVINHYGSEIYYTWIYDWQEGYVITIDGELYARQKDDSFVLIRSS